METLNQPLAPAYNPEFIVQPTEAVVAHELGATALETVLQNPDSAVETSTRRYDQLTHPLPSDKEGLKKSLALASDETGDQQLEAIAWQTEQDHDTARVAINMPVRALPRMIQTGRYLSAVETGIGTSSNRGPYEVSKGYREEGEPHLVYGYLTTKDASSVEIPPTVRNFGGAQITLKPEVTDRATFILGDSMDLSQNSASLRNLDDALLLEEARRLHTQVSVGLGKTADFVEAQIHDGVGVSDIESITIPLDTTKKSTGQALQETVSMLEQGLPDVEKTIKIDVTEAMINSEEATRIDEVTRIASEHPGIKFELVVRQTYREDYDRATRTAPFLERKNGLHTEEVISAGYKRMAERLASLSGKLSDYAKDKLDIANLPANLVLVPGIGEGDFVAPVDSYDPQGILRDKAA